MSGGAIIAIQNRYINAFRKAGATSKLTAKTLREIGIVPIGIFYRMEKIGVFEKTDENKYFLNEEKMQEYLVRRRRFAWIMLGIIGIGLLIAYLSSGTI